ncbi:SGNH/GDSL hydrolase family protein [Agromyces sp. CFH 90414]|uniref:SGNH/GDSL hydrolase family protein n=1 Tax=Agromyces agglutinans TaxID=2662258 RepID=A0A6I2FBS9_9MICO|nr:SGNH/GDSL hydrolase family protein [Agromyces agglutinans]MRG60160.1 SGNH/GDSL hydrolase family protein [Agromyces agglutinans]
MRDEPRAEASVIEAIAPVALVGGLVVGTALAARAAWQAFRARLTRNSLILNETLPVHSKWWRDHAKAPGEVLYVALGDSAAQGIGASRPDHSYVGVLAREIRSVTGRSVRVVNLAVSGATVELAVRDQLPKLAKFRPDVMTVAIGANDIAVWDEAAFERGIRTILAAVPPHTLVADLPYFYFPRNERRVAVANRIIRAVAAEHGLTVVPLHDETRYQGVRRMFTHFAMDWFHPNDHGYRVWADAFRPSLVASLTARFPADPAIAPSATDAATVDASADAVADVTADVAAGVGGAR